MSTTEFKKYNRKYIIVQSFDDTKLPADDEVLGEGVVIVYTPTGDLLNAEKCKIGDGSTIFADLAWLGADEINLQTKIVSPAASTQNIVPDAGYDGLGMVTVNPCTGTVNITSTSQYSVVGKQYAKVSDTDLVASNIKSGVNILGVLGTYLGDTGEPFEGSLTIHMRETETLTLNASLNSYLVPINDDANGENEDGLILYTEFNDGSAEITAQRAGEIPLRFVDEANGHELSVTLIIEEIYILPDLTTPAAVGNVLEGKEYIDANGQLQVGTLPKADYWATSFTAEPSFPSAVLSLTEQSGYRYNQVSFSAQPFTVPTIAPTGYISHTYYVGGWHTYSKIHVCSEAYLTIPNATMIVQQLTNSGLDTTTFSSMLSVSNDIGSTKDYWVGLTAGAIVIIQYNLTDSYMDVEITNSTHWTKLAETEGLCVLKFNGNYSFTAAPTDGLKITFYK